MYLSFPIGRPPLHETEELAIQPAETRHVCPGEFDVVIGTEFVQPRAEVWSAEPDRGHAEQRGNIRCIRARDVAAVQPADGTASQSERFCSPEHLARTRLK